MLIGAQNVKSKKITFNHHTPATMKLPPSSLLASVILTGLPSISASAIHSNPSETIDDIDTGILGHSIGPADPPLFRELQSTCPATCSSDLCDCVVKYGYAEPCAQQLHDVCQGNAGTIADCVLSEYVYYYENVYCPFATCRVGGGTYEKCQCDSYVDFCDIYQNKPGYETDAKTLKYCSIATCCKGETDDEGRKTCLEESFENKPVSGSIADIIGADKKKTTDGVSAEEDAAPSSAGNARNLAVSVVCVGVFSLPLMS